MKTVRVHFYLDRFHYFIISYYRFKQVHTTHILCMLHDVHYLWCGYLFSYMFVWLCILDDAKFVHGKFVVKIGKNDFVAISECWSINNNWWCVCVCVYYNDDVPVTSLNWDVEMYVSFALTSSSLNVCAYARCHCVSSQRENLFVNANIREYAHHFSRSDSQIYKTNNSFKWNICGIFYFKCSS